jgi:membrane-associated protease RseP (regulator of RpoE activity)
MSETALPPRGTGAPSSRRPSEPTPIVTRKRWIAPASAAITALTLTLTGAVIWPSSPFPLERPSDLLQPGFLLSGVPYALGVLIVLASHEGGHWLACRLYRIPTSAPLLIPGIPPLGTFGAILRIRGAIPHRRALFDVAASGPLAGFAVSLPMLSWGLAEATPLAQEASDRGLILGAPLLLILGRAFLGVPEGAMAVGPVFIAGWFGMFLTSVNLFPVGQLDGGHTVYALSPRLHRFVAWLTIALLALFVVGLLLAGKGLSPYLLWGVVLLFLRGRHPRLAEEHAPLGPGRRFVALVLLALFLLCFIPVPLSVG